jgi:Golgi nucleoside diphosphatase
MELHSYDGHHSSGLAFIYQIKLREPKVAIDINKPAPAEEFLEFKVKVKSDKEKMKELQRMVKQLNKEKAQVEQWSAKQQEKIQGFKNKRKEQKSFLKEL